MNQSKQIKKSSNKTKQNRQTGMIAGKEKWIIGIVSAAVILICAIVVWDNHHPKLILTVNDEKLYLEDLMYDVFNTEMSYDYMSQLYQQMGSTDDYWNMQQQNGQTTKEMAKNDCLESAKRQVVLYDEAIKNGYKLTKEDTKGAKKDAKELMKNISAKAKKATGFTEDKLISIIEKRKITARYKEDKIKSYGITKEAVASTIEKDKFRQYSLDTFFISTKKTDEKGNEINLAEADKQKLYGKMEAVLEKAKDAKDWSKVIETKEDEKEKSAEEVSYSAYDFIESESKFDEDTTKKIVAMKNGEMSKILETKDGYYLVKMKDNNSTERYDKEVEDALKTKEDTKFEEDYTKMAESYTFKVNEKEWEKIDIGTITL